MFEIRKLIIGVFSFCALCLVLSSAIVLITYFNAVGTLHEKTIEIGNIVMQFNCLDNEQVVDGFTMYERVADNLSIVTANSMCLRFRDDSGTFIDSSSNPMSVLDILSVRSSSGNLCYGYSTAPQQGTSITVELNGFYEFNWMFGIQARIPISDSITVLGVRFYKGV